LRVFVGVILTGLLISSLLMAIFVSNVTYLDNARFNSLFYSFLLIALLSGLGLFLLILSRQGKKSKESTFTSTTRNEEFIMGTISMLVKELKERHRELETFNENILQSVPSGVLTINNNGIITKINEAGRSIICGASNSLDSNVVGRPINEVIKGEFLEYILKNEFIKREEVLVELGGRKVWLGFSISPLMDRNKKVIGKSIIFTDITEFKELQARAKLKDTLQGLGEMAAGIAHELRNPMSVISGYASILKKKADSSLQPIVDAITKEIALMDRIITDFLSFAKYEEPAPVPVDIERLIKEIADEIRGSVSNHYLISLQIEPCVLHADEILLRQALKNLIQNAIEAMPEGGEVTIKGVKGDAEYLISISDTGKGIPDEIKEKIFIPFFTTKEKGTGLGLSIVHKVITAHGGEVFFDSTKEGTTFTLKLPVWWRK